MSQPTPRLDRSTLRLATGYLAIIGSLCVIFSGVIYLVAVSGLSMKLDTDNSGSINIHTGTSSTLPSRVPNPTSDSQLQSTTSELLDRQLQRQTRAIRSDTLMALVIFNGAAIVLAIPLSYWLAARTMRPVHRAIDAQMRFASDASHELRTPLTVMQAELEVVLNTTNLSLKRAKSALASNLEEVQHLRQLTENLLLLARDEKPDLLAENITPIIDTAIDRVQALAAAKNITLHTTTARAVWPVHATSLAQAIVALLENAIKYSPDGATVEVRCGQDKSSLRITVIDSGAGIDKHDISHITKRFYRADHARHGVTVEGHGLGLSIAERIVKRHGGRLDIVSEIGAGTTVSIVLGK